MSIPPPCGLKPSSTTDPRSTGRLELCQPGAAEAAEVGVGHAGPDPQPRSPDYRPGIAPALSVNALIASARCPSPAPGPQRHVWVWQLPEGPSGVSPARPQRPPQCPLQGHVRAQCLLGRGVSRPGTRFSPPAIKAEGLQPDLRHGAPHGPCGDGMARTCLLSRLGTCWGAAEDTGALRTRPSPAVPRLPRHPARHRGSTQRRSP